MKLAGRWVTCNSYTTFVRDEPVTPQPVPRARDVPKKKVRTGPKPGKVLPRSDDFDEDKSRMIRANHWADHRRLLERRAAGDYDRPVPSDYARKLIRAKEMEEKSGARTEVECLILAAMGHAARELAIRTGDYSMPSFHPSDYYDEMDAFFVIGSKMATEHPSVYAAWRMRNFRKYC